MATLTLQAAFQELNTRYDFYINPANRTALLGLAQQVNAMRMLAEST